MKVENCDTPVQRLLAWLLLLLLAVAIVSACVSGLVRIDPVVGPRAIVPHDKSFAIHEETVNYFFSLDAYNKLIQQSC